MEYIQENQEFTSKDAILVLASLGLLIGVIAYLIHLSALDYRGNGAQRDLIRVSRQLVIHAMGSQVSDLPLQSPEVRGPASVREPLKVFDLLGYEGQIGKDPWGHPYVFKFQKNESGLQSVAVWSRGPNGKSEFDGVRARGDDLAHIETFPR